MSEGELIKLDEAHASGPLAILIKRLHIVERRIVEIKQIRANLAHEGQSLEYERGELQRAYETLRKLIESGRAV